MSSPAKSKALILIGSCLLACPVIFPIAAFIFCGTLPRGYTSTAVIEVKYDHSLRTGPPGSQFDDAHFVQNQFVILQSKEILYPVIDSLGLVAKWSAGQTGALTKDAAYVRLYKMVHISNLPNTDMMRISVTGADPQEAADIANTIAVLYKRRRIVDQSKLIDHDLQEMTDEIERQRKKVDEAAAETAKIRIQSGIVDTNPDSSNSVDAAHPEYQAAKQKYIDAKKLLDAAEQRLQTARLEIKIGEPHVQIWETAEPAGKPSTPNVPRIVLLAFCAGLLPAIPGAFMVYAGLRSKL